VNPLLERITINPKICGGVLKRDPDVGISSIACENSSPVLGTGSPDGALCIVEPGRLRIHLPLDEDALWPQRSGS
jgi:hypothetical protein